MRAEETSKEDKELQKWYALAMMAEGIFILPGHPGGISTAHSEYDVDEKGRLTGRKDESLR